MGSKQSDEANWASATNDQRVAEAEAGTVDAGKGNRERFEQRTLFEGQAIGKAMQPGLWMHMVAAKCSMMRRGGEEDNIGTGVVAASATEVTGGLGAWHTALESDAVACSRSSVQ